MLTRKQSWRRRSIFGSTIVRDSHHDFLYSEGLTADTILVPMRSLSEPIFSNRCNLCNASGTRSVDNFGSAQENASICECSVINKRKADKDKPRQNNNKKVKFHLNVRVVLIPTKNEYENAGLTNLIWWDETDYITFRDSAANELKRVVEKLSLDVKDAIKVLYQPCNSVESEELYVKTQFGDSEEDDESEGRQGGSKHREISYVHTRNKTCGKSISVCDLHKKAEVLSNKQHCVAFTNYVSVRASDISAPSSSAAFIHHKSSSESILTTTGFMPPATHAPEKKHKFHQKQRQSEENTNLSKHEAVSRHSMVNNQETLSSDARSSLMKYQLQVGHLHHHSSYSSKSPKSVVDGNMSPLSHFVAEKAESVALCRAIPPSVTESLCYGIFDFTTLNTTCTNTSISQEAVT